MIENLILIQGDDDYTKEEYVNKIKSGFKTLSKGVNYLVFDKDNISMLPEELSTYSFFNEDKLIIVKVPKRKSTKTSDDEEDAEEDTKSSSTNWYTEDLEDKIINKIDNITLVFIEEGNLKSKISSLVSKYGVCKAFNKEKPRQLNDYATNYAKENGFSLSYDLSTYLVQICGNNKRNIVNELNKLFFYVDNKQIKKEDIDKICIRTPEVIVFDLTDALGEKNTVKALRVLDELLDNKEALQKLFIMIANHFKNLLLTKECIERNLSVESTLDMKPFSAMKYKGQCKGFKKDELVQIVKDFAYLDIDSKLGKIDLKIGLQKIIMSR